jgi:DoxX
LDQHLFWAILFGWFVVKGAGPISPDALIRRGIAATALPLAGTITRIFEAMSRWGDPAIKLLLRCWIAALFFRSGVMKISNFDMTQMLFHAQSSRGLLPAGLAARLTILIELGCLALRPGGGHEDHRNPVDGTGRRSSTPPSGTRSTSLTT